jgi:hypothetical protein
MGTVCVQTQMLAAPSTVMAEQTVGGLVEHPEQPMAIDVANPHFHHNALVTPVMVCCQSRRKRRVGKVSVSRAIDQTPTLATAGTPTA